MTEQQSRYVIPGSHNLKIPTRSEFHKLAMHQLTDMDFKTDEPNQATINQIAKAIHWSLNSSRYNKKIF